MRTIALLNDEIRARMKEITPSLASAFINNKMALFDILHRVRMKTKTNNAKTLGITQLNTFIMQETTTASATTHHY